MRSPLWTATTAFAIASTASALGLKELPHQDGLRYTKRGDPLSCLSLRSEEYFLWGADDGSQTALGNLTVRMPGSQENILSMERFSEMLTNVTCTQTSIDMAFKDNDTFAFAKTVWDWVNGDDNNTFVMVAGVGACGWNTDQRQPFMVSSLTFNDTANVAYLSAQALDWAQAIHSYKLDVGGIPTGQLKKRGFGDINFNKELNLDFNHKFPVDTVSLPIVSGLAASLDLSNCSTSGVFAFQFSLETVLLIPKSASLTLHPQGVALTLDPSLAISGNASQPVTASIDLATFSLANIQIGGGILNIGPQVVLGVGATLGPLQGEVSVSAGVVYSLPDSAVASVDFMSLSATQSGWTPSVATIPVKVQAEFDGEVDAFVNAELELAATAFGMTFDVGLGLQPYVTADLATVTAKSGSCGASDGLAINPSLGVNLTLNAHAPVVGTLFDLTLFSFEEPLPGTCLAFSSTSVAPAASS